MCIQIDKRTYRIDLCIKMKLSECLKGRSIAEKAMYERYR